MLNWVTDQTKSNKALKFLKEGIAQKYTMTIRSEIQMGSILSKTVTECRWALNVLDITDGGYELELLTLDNVMLETNNPSLKDIATMNNVFGQMYNELRFTVNRKGELLQVKNIEQLRKRWKHVRTELYEVQGRFTSIEEVLKLNDEVFANEKQLFDVIKATEFFELYFNGIYGKVLPSTEYITKKSRFQLADVSCPALAIHGCRRGAAIDRGAWNAQVFHLFGVAVAPPSVLLAFLVVVVVVVGHALLSGIEHFVAPLRGRLRRGTGAIVVAILPDRQGAHVLYGAFIAVHALPGRLGLRRKRGYEAV